MTKLLNPTSFAHAVPAPHAHVVDCDTFAHCAELQGRSQMKRLHLIRDSQRETVAASSPPRNRFAALDDEVDIVPRNSESDLIASRVVGQSAGGNRVVDVVHMGTPRQESSGVTESVEFPDEGDSIHSSEESVAGDSVDSRTDVETLADVALPREAIIRAAIRSMVVCASCGRDEISATFFEGPIPERIEVGIARGHSEQRRG